MTEKRRSAFYKIYGADGKYWKRLKMTKADAEDTRKRFPKVRVVRTKPNKKRSSRYGGGFSLF